MNVQRWVLMLMLLATMPVVGENWPQFRGPHGDGTSSEKGLPIHWSTSSNILWKTAIPGEGHSSPIVWEDSVFLTSTLKEQQQRVLMRLDANKGKILWQRNIIMAETEPMHGENSSASSTPCTDGMHVITSFQVGERVDLRCFDYEGRQLWSSQPLKFEGEHGYSYSPIIHKGLVLFDCRQEGEAALLALDVATGKIRWRAEPDMKRISHVPPLLINHGGKEQLVVSGSNETRSYEPLTGKPIWWTKGPSDVAVAGLVYGDDMVFATAGYPARTRLAVRVTGQGDVTEKEVAWSLRKQVTYVPSPVFHEGHVYTVVDEGIAFCFDAKSGQSKWEHRLGGRFRSSLILAEGRVYATNDKGLTTVFEAKPDAFRALASNDLKEFCYATPAVSKGKLFVRTGENLYCIGTAE